MTSVARDIFVRRYVVPLLSGDEMKKKKIIIRSYTIISSQATAGERRKVISQL